METRSDLHIGITSLIPATVKVLLVSTRMSLLWFKWLNKQYGACDSIYRGITQQ